MEKIVASLTQQHDLLSQEITTFHQALEARRLDEMRVALDRLSQILTAHCQFEDRDFYPHLLERVKHDAAMHRTVSLFHGNFGRIADGVQAFFKRWNGPLSAEQLPMIDADWHSALKLLSGRIRDEEKILIPLCRRLFADSKPDAEPIAQPRRKARAR